MERFLFAGISFTIFGATFGFFPLGKWRRFFSTIDSGSLLGGHLRKVWQAMFYFGWLFVMPTLVLLPFAGFPLRPAELLVGSAAGFVGCFAGERFHHYLRSRVMGTAGLIDGDEL